MDETGTQQKSRRHLLSVVALNVPGLLARVIELFSGRGYNIENLTVGHAESDKHKDVGGSLSRITILSFGTDAQAAVIVSHLEKIIDVIEVENLTDNRRAVQADVTLVKVSVSRTNKQADAITLASGFRATAILTDPEYIIFRFVGREDASKDFIAAMRRFGPIESSYSGITVLA